MYIIKDDTGFNGHWKNSRHQNKTCADTNIPFVDAKVAAALCKGDVVVYAFEPQSGKSDGWMLDHVTPNMVSHGIPHQVCLVLG